MNYNVNNKNQEPRRVSVEIAAGDDSHRIVIDNDNICTTCTDGDDGITTTILQSRTAFRGFIMALTELMSWKVIDAWDSSDEGYHNSSLKY